MAKAIYKGVAGVARKITQPYIGVETFKPVTLPDGYTQVEYIQSSGTQYIDTGVGGSGNLEFDIDFETDSKVSTSDFGDIFGSVGSGQFRLGTYPDTTGGGFFYNNTLYNPSLVTGKRLNVSLKNGTLTINGVAQAVSSQTFTVGQNIYVFGGNHRGIANQLSKTKLYSFSMFVDGVLVRHFIPCTNTSGTAGLYDLVGGNFYTNAGTGSFAVATYSTSKARKVKKGYIGVNGVARQFYTDSQPLNDFSVGDIVKLNVNGTAKDFIIIHKGKPSEKYAGSSDGVWLMMKDLYTKMAFDSTNNDYENSDIHAYLNGTFLSSLDSSVQAVINTVKIPYFKGSGGENAQTGENGLSTKVFLLAGSEINITEAQLGVYLLDEGTTLLDYFSDVIPDDPSTKMIAYYNGVGTSWWTRSAAWAYVKKVWTINGDIGRGSYNTDCTATLGVRPALVLPYTVMVSDDLLITG